MERRVSCLPSRRTPGQLEQKHNPIGLGYAAEGQLRGRSMGQEDSLSGEAYGDLYGGTANVPNTWC